MLQIEGVATATASLAGGLLLWISQRTLTLALLTCVNQPTAAVSIWSSDSTYTGYHATSAGEYVPFWSFWPPWSFGHGNSFESLTLQIYKKDALELRKVLTTHPHAKGLGYTQSGGAQGGQKGGGQAWA